MRTSGEVLSYESSGWRATPGSSVGTATAGRCIPPISWDERVRSGGPFSMFSTLDILTTREQLKELLGSRCSPQDLGPRTGLGMARGHRLQTAGTGRRGPDGGRLRP